MVILNIIFGFLGGVFGGLGMGGGTVLIPILTILLNVQQQTAQGVNLLSFVVMAIFSIIVHLKNGYIVTKGLFSLIIGGVIFSFLGALIALNISSNLLRSMFGVFLCVLAINEAIKVFKRQKK
jgi:uncharacterized membrane protein YfcA